MSILRNLFGALAGLLHLLGLAWNTVVEVARPVLEILGFVSPHANDVAANEAADAVARNNSPSSVNRRAAIWSPETKNKAIADWCAWKTGSRPGAEPSLAGLTLKEKLKLRAADERTLAVLPLRTLSEIEAWMQSPKKALPPLTPDQLAFRKAAFEQDNREIVRVTDRWKAIASEPAAGIVSDMDDLISQLETDLTYRPTGPALA